MWLRCLSHEDLESVAEQELLKAAKMIEEAAKQLLAVKSQPRPPKPAGKVDVTGEAAAPKD